MAPKHASETAAMNIYESSYDLSWASPTLRLAIHSQLFTWTYLFGYRGWSKLHVEGGMVLNPKHPGTPPEVWYDWTPKTYKYQTPSFKRGYIAWMSIGVSVLTGPARSYSWFWEGLLSFQGNVAKSCPKAQLRWKLGSEDWYGSAV